MYILLSGSPASRMLIGIIFIVIYIAEIMFYHKHFDPRKKHEEDVARAEAMGHKVVATLTSSRMYMTNADESKFAPEYYCRYEYEVNGKTYGHVERYTSSPPRQITLYYLDNPKKVFTKDPPTDTMVLPLLIIAIALSAGVYYLLFGAPQ